MEAPTTSSSYEQWTDSIPMSIAFASERTQAKSNVRIIKRKLYQDRVPSVDEVISEEPFGLIATVLRGAREFLTDEMVRYIIQPIVQASKIDLSAFTALTPTNFTSAPSASSVSPTATVISLRLLDWLAVNYSKLRNITYAVPNVKTRVMSQIITERIRRQLAATGTCSLIDALNDQHDSITEYTDFNMATSYSQTLASAEKDYFRAFCRGRRVAWTFADGAAPFITAPSQLHFFRWAIQYSVIGYALYDHAAIDGNMRTLTRMRRSLRNSAVQSGKPKRKRERLVDNNSQLCEVHHLTYHIAFPTSAKKAEREGGDSDAAE
jgi:hypothetical protein